MADQLQILSWQTLENLLSAGASFEQPVEGITNCAVIYDLSEHRLGVEIPVKSLDLPKTLPLELSFSVEKIAGITKLVVSCSTEELFRSFYDFIHEILEAVHTNILTPIEAVEEAWSKWGRLIERESSLSREKQVGLLGELWLLEKLAEIHGWTYALDSWHETSVSEHDFCLSNRDIEVKTSTSEGRSHLISSLTQLLPALDRELFILSVHLTSAPMIAAGSFSLASRVLFVLNLLESDQNNLNRFKERLKQVGWKEEHMSSYQLGFVFRNSTRLIRVDERCPRIIETTLGNLGELRSLISSVSYRIDVAGLGVEDGDLDFETVFAK
jgi:hypothetical protein